MKKIAALLIVLLVSVAFQQQTFAQATRTWVSGVGDDVNPCSRTAPCKTFQGALAKTAAGGEVNILDPGGYGAVTIDKSIIISGYGSTAGVLMTSQAGITVNAGPYDVVILRNLNINGFGASLAGIKYVSGAQLHIEECNISGMGSGYAAISVEHSGKGLLTVNNTNINGPNNTVSGVVVSTSSASDTLKATLTNVRISGLHTAIKAQYGSNINVIDCVISGNTIGVLAEQSNAIIRLSNTHILNNSVGIGNGGFYAGKIFSFGNNLLAGNGKDWPMTTVITPQ